MNKRLLHLIFACIFLPMMHAQDTAVLFDGPYIRYNKNKIYIQNIHIKQGTKFVTTDSSVYSAKKPVTVQVPTDIAGQTFSVVLKSKLSDEKSETNKVDKIFILSDIEANFKAFRELLQANKIIDDEFNWLFGDGHLVLTGDFFDRGNQLSEVLWLIYSLEEKAKAAKGYVHFVLGNHEIMNLNGDLRYVHSKYYEHAKLLNRTYLSLYDENTELGRWLRTKNIMEKVGPILFMHGGASRYINYMAAPIDEINKMARPYYADTTYNYPDKKIELLFSDEGPLWYRGYYLGKDKATMGQVDSTLNLYGTSYIATGHTIVSEVINSYFNGKIFNTDVSHAKGFSQAILFENKKFYRVNNKGERWELNGTK